MKGKIILGILIIALSLGFIIYNKNNNTKNTEAVNSELRDKIGQMLIVGFRGTEINKDSKIIQDINNLNLGGIILFDYDVPSKGEITRNIENKEQLSTLISDIKNLTNTDLFIAVDAEGGYVNRLKPKYGFETIESAESIAKKSNEEIYNNSLLLSQELKELGFNLNFAPVVDVNINPDNPVIGYLERSASSDPEVVYNYASIFIDAMHENNILTAIKHFPGHGSSSEDSHLGLVDVTETYEQEKELAPYTKLIQDGNLDMIMTAHIINQNIDEENPATLSPLFLQNILKQELGYEGIIVSDDMQMGAIVENYGFEEAIIKAINSGCDILIFSNNNQTYDEDIAEKAIDIIENAVNNNVINIENIENSYQKIKELKDYNL
jgi:beta-N-acetylhexosaminidase